MSTARSAHIIADKAAFLSPVERELKLVEETLAGELSSSVETVAALSSHVLEAGGKRLRPSLVLLSAKACADSFDEDRIVRMAAVAEMVHMATLIHDDVIDQSDSRRGRPTANAQWGNQVSVLTGDYIVARGFALLARYAEPRIMQVLAQATVAMTEGEISQLEATGRTETQIDAYYSIIRNKTAAFISACCESGAILSGAGESAEACLTQYGFDIGMAFQITDDVLDLVGDSKRTGKPIGGDIREGKMTLPLILTMERATPDDRKSVGDIIQSCSASPEEIDYVRRIAVETGAIDGAREAAADFVNRAIADLSPLPATEAKESLSTLTTHILTREK